MIENKRDHIDFDSNIDILDWTLERNRNIFLELLDIFLWAIRLKNLDVKWVKLTYNQIARKELYTYIEPLFKYRLNYWPARMKNSRFEHFWAFSSARIEFNKWEFEDLNLVLSNSNIWVDQPSLF